MPTPLHQIAALAHVYRRLVIVYVTLPTAMLVSPVVSWVALALLQQCTDHALLTVALTMLLTAAARNQMYRLFLAPPPPTTTTTTTTGNNNKQTAALLLDDVLHNNQVRLPAFMFVVSCVTSRVLGPVIDRLGPSSSSFSFMRKFGILSNTTGAVVAISTAVRVASAMAVLGILVAARFAGPTSIMRLSPFPLVSNPFDVTIRHALKNPWSTLFSTDESGAAASLFASSGRRFQRPTAQAFAQHIFLSLVAGAAVTYTAVLPLAATIRDNADDDPFARSAILTSCILTALGTLVSVLDGVSHEIDPRHYLYPSSSNWYTKLRNKIVQQVVYVALPVPLLSIAVTMLMTSEVPTHIGRLYMELTGASVILALYVFFMDEAIRTSLFHPRPDIHQLVDELNGDDTTAVTRLSVILCSLLSDPLLVKVVWRPSHQPGIGGPEREELKLSEKLTNHMASVFLRRIDPQTEAPLEEDVLRIAILESLGGRLSPSDVSGVVSERHQKTISEWIDLQIPRGQKLYEPLSTPLVRGLCVFMGGAGEALTICATTSADTGMWKIPPAVFVCMEFSVQAVARCIVRSLSPSGRILCDWKSSHLAIQVPAALRALFQLRRGIVQYSKFVNRETSGGAFVSNEVGAHVTAHYGEIVRACDFAATSILHSLKSLKGLGRIDLSLDRDCLEWKNTLLARGSH